MLNGVCNVKFTGVKLKARGPDSVRHIISCGLTDLCFLLKYKVRKFSALLIILY